MFRNATQAEAIEVGLVYGDAGAADLAGDDEVVLRQFPELPGGNADGQCRFLLFRNLNPMELIKSRRV